MSGVALVIHGSRSAMRLIGFADQIVGGGIQNSARMKLIADAADRAVRDHLAGFIFQCRVRLEKLPKSAQLLRNRAQSFRGMAWQIASGESNVSGKINVPPAARRKAASISTLCLLISDFLTQVRRCRPAIEVNRMHWNSTGVP